MHAPGNQIWIRMIGVAGARGGGDCTTGAGRAHAAGRQEEDDARGRWRTAAGGEEGAISTPRRVGRRKGLLTPIRHSLCLYICQGRASRASGKPQRDTRSRTSQPHLTLPHIPSSTCDWWECGRNGMRIRTSARLSCGRWNSLPSPVQRQRIPDR